MTLVVNLPCGQCAHAQVCRIREGLEASLDGAVAPTYEDPAIQVDVALDVSCAHFLAGTPTAVREAVALATELDRALSSAHLLDDLTESAPDGPSLDSSDDASDERAPEPVAVPAARGVGWTPEKRAAAAERARAQGAARQLARAAEQPVPATPPTVEQLAETGHAPARQVVTRGAPLEPVRIPCEPGCGGSYVKGVGFAAHRRHCADWQAYVAAHGRDVEPLRGAAGPAPVPGAVDPLEGREADETKHHARARAKADETWRKRHGAST